jgi:hypothetical protein
MDALSRTWGHYGELVLPCMCTPEVAMCVFGASLCTTAAVDAMSGSSRSEPGASHTPGPPYIAGKSETSPQGL